MKRALITGITGQDGSYLAELLLKKGYHVFGFARKKSWNQPNAASHLAGKVDIIFGDMSNRADITTAITDAAPHELYNLASQSRPSESWKHGSETLLTNAGGFLTLLEELRRITPGTKLYHASSSEMFGEPLTYPQNENTPFNPRSPYAAAKIYSHHLAGIYRESYGLYISCGILFNHESERRQLHFVSQKIAYGAACAALGIENSKHLNETGLPIVRDGKLALGNLGVSRDWGYAGDFVRAMWLMLKADKPQDFVIGTGVVHTLQELCELAYGLNGLDWRHHVVTDKTLVRPLDSGRTLSDSTRAHRELGWFPTVSFEEMVEKMVQAQMVRLTEGRRS